MISSQQRREQLELLTVQERLRDYKVADLHAERDELVRRWREAYPDAAKEQSGAFRPLIRMDDWRQSGPTFPQEVWYNDIYNVTVRRHADDPVFGTRGGMVQLGISSHDSTARHDWRDYQAIKNQLAGPECEGFELYPADSRLVDPSNYYTLWCFPGLKRIKVGIDERNVRDADTALAPQRAMAKEEER